MSPADDGRDGASAAIMRREMFGDWPPVERQCEVTTRRELRCPNVAKYVLIRADRPAYVCDSCMPAWLHTFTQRGPVTVERAPKNGSTESQP